MCAHFVDFFLITPDNHFLIFSLKNLTNLDIIGMQNLS